MTLYPAKLLTYSPMAVLREMLSLPSGCVPYSLKMERSKRKGRRNEEKIGGRRGVREKK